MTNCAYHPERDAVGACVNCGKLVCAECKTTLGGKIYCNPCVDKEYSGITKSTSDQGRLAVIPKEVRGRNWGAFLLKWIRTRWGIGLLAGILVVSVAVIIIANQEDGSILAPEPEPAIPPAPVPVVSMLDGATRFTGTLPPVADLTYTTREGDTLTIQGYPGLISLFVDPDTTRSVVEEKLKAFDAQVVGAIPLAGLYLVQVTPGQEPALTLALYSESWVLDSSPASPTARAVMVALDFHTFDGSFSNPCAQLHGGKVKEVMQRSGRTVVAIDVDPIGTENDLLLSIAQASRVIEEMERAFKTNERLVINISLQSGELNHWSSKERTEFPDEYSRAIRAQQYIYYNSFLQAMEATFRKQPEVVDNTLITFIAGNAGVDLDNTIDKLRVVAPNAIQRVKFVGGADASGKVIKKYNHLKDTSDKGNRMVYARGEDVQIGGTFCDGTSFAGPEVARVLDLIWSQNPELTSVQLLDAFDKALAEMGTDNVLPQDENGLTTLAFINRVMALVGGAQELAFSVGILPEATIGKPYHYSFCDPEPAPGLFCGGPLLANAVTNNPTGGTPNYTFSHGIGLPFGLILNLNGVLTGMPAEHTPTGPQRFDIYVTDQAGGKVTYKAVINVNPAEPTPTPAPTLVPTPRPTPTTAITFTVPPELLPSATVDEPYSFSFATAPNPSGGNPPYTFVLGSGVGFPPLGLIMDQNGKLSGTPTTKGTSTFEVCVKDLSGNQVCGTTSLTVAPPPITFVVPDTLPPATVGFDYKFDFSTTDNPAGGNPPYTFTIGSGEGSQPFDLILDENGLLNGTPTTAGIWQFKVCVKDLSGNQVCAATTSLTAEEGPGVFTTGSFSGSGDFTRPFPAYGTSCTFSNTFTGTVDLTMTLEADETYSGSVSVSGNWVSIAISGGNASLTCIDSSTRWNSTNQISGTSPDIIWSTSFVTPGGSTVTGDFTGKLISRSYIIGDMLITLDTSTGSVSIPITITVQ